LSLGDELISMKPANVKEAKAIGKILIAKVIESEDWSIKQYFTNKHGGIQDVSNPPFFLRNSPKIGERISIDQ
jgi:hypothetical protein